MRMIAKARFSMQILVSALAVAVAPIMAQTQAAAPVKTTPTKAEACTFVPASADGKEQICVKAGAKTGTAPKVKAQTPANTATATARKPVQGPSVSPAKPSLASGEARNRGTGLALKSTTALKTPPISKTTELASSRVSPAVVAPPAAPATVAPATTVPAVAVAPPLASAAAPALAPQSLPAGAAAPVVAPTAAAATATVATTGATTPRATPGARKLRPDEAVRRFTDGLELERKGEPQAALLAYLDAAESGNGQAQKRLGDIYGTGTAYAERDYGLALKWYERARAQGVEIPKPFTFSGLRQ